MALVNAHYLATSRGMIGTFAHQPQAHLIAQGSAQVVPEAAAIDRHTAGSWLTDSTGAYLT